MNDAERIRELKSLWLKRPENERTANHVLAFYGWLKENRPACSSQGREIRISTFRQI